MLKLRNKGEECLNHVERERGCLNHVARNEECLSYVTRERNAYITQKGIRTWYSFSQTQAIEFFFKLHIKK
jgi:hypothetical protein